ncbi:hypothetical protein LPJ79_001393 [Coemansia sp. RSA 1821]|nr:hypothetical protein LPJ79_001393 [Coemansia sp. RSA 1821]
MAAVIKNNLVIIDDPVEHTGIMKGCLADLAKAKAQNSKAKADFESITSNYTASETKYNAVTSRHSAEQKIAKVKDEIEFSIAFEGYIISPKQIYVNNTK